MEYQHLMLIKYMEKLNMVLEKEKEEFLVLEEKYISIIFIFLILKQKAIKELEWGKGSPGPGTYK